MFNGKFVGKTYVPVLHLILAKRPRNDYVPVLTFP